MVLTGKTKLAEIEFRSLLPGDAESISQILKSATRGYSNYFTPFEFDSHVIRDILERCQYDIYNAIFFREELLGFYMLRGIDEGFDVPSYGVFISESHAGMGLGRLTLYHAICTCRFSGIKKLMLKVHEENVLAKNLYESIGFELVGFDEHKSCLIYNYSVVR